MRTFGEYARPLPARGGRRRVAVIACAAIVFLGVLPAATGGASPPPQPPPQPPVDTPQRHAAEDHVVHDATTEARLQAETRRQTAGDAAAAASAVSANPADSGAWGPVVDWPVVGVHVALLPNGNVLAYDSVGDKATETYPNQTFTRAAVLDPATGVQTRADVSTYNVFCSGLAHLADGRVFLAGGNKNQQLEGIAQTHLFDPASSTWATGPNMAAGRWYPTVTALGNGEQLITSGYPTVPEVYQNNGTLRSLSTASLSQPLYPWMDVAPDGRVVDTGPANYLRKIDPAANNGTGSWQFFGGRDGVNRDYGSRALYDIGKILVAGGGKTADRHANSSAAVVDITGSTPSVTATAPMASPRRQHDLTVLADGTVLATGGLSSDAGLVDLNNGVYNAELWNPATGQWRMLAAESVPRQYHSSAILLPDGRVLSSGGGICGTCDAVGYLAKNAQVFSPPYLFGPDGQPAARPTISSAPSAIVYKGGFDVTTPDAASITKAALVKLGAVTHSNNMEQRYVPLSLTAGSGTLHLTGPANANLAPRGHYMLFLVNSAGVPSVAKIISLDEDLPPTVQITAPASGTSYAFKSTVTIQAAAADDRAVSKVEFFAGGSRLGEDTSSPYSFTWPSVSPGKYTLTARATDDTAHTTTSAPVTITVRRKNR